jgi:hypothetical protein
MGRAGLIIVVAAAAACIRGTPAPRQSEALERSARILRQLDRLEADLHEQNGEIATWGELVDRHARAEQIACKVTDEHVSEIHRLAVAQQQKLEQKRSRKKKALALNHRPSPRNTLAVR